MKAFAYVRVSTEKQVAAETPENQKKAIREYATQNDIEIAEWFEDAGVSGASKERDAFNDMMARLDEVDAIIVWDLSRTARNLDLGIANMFALRDQKKLLYEVKTRQKRDFANMNDQLIHLITSWADEVARDTIKVNQKKGIERYKTKNGRWGPKPKEFTPKDWKEYEDLKAAGVGMNKIANYFKVHRNTLAKMVARGK